MAIGPFIRRLFGRYERQISDLYRAIFFDVDAYVEGLKRWVPEPKRILEVGAGEGAVTERLARAFPKAEIVGIDVSPKVGRLYSGPRDRVRFIQAPVEAFAAEDPGRFDLIILSDVLHHVPLELRTSLLATIRALLTPAGSFAFKEWERDNSPVYWLGYVSDRWITGDRIVYLRREEIDRTIHDAFGPNSLIAEQRIKPWRNNLSTLVRP